MLAFRRYFFSQFALTGLLAPGTDPLDGIANPAPGAGEGARKVLFQLVRSGRLRILCLKPELWSFLDRFLGGMSYLHKRKLIRYTRPNDPSSTGAHYDLIYLRGGTKRLVTAWIPVGDAGAHGWPYLSRRLA